MVLICQMSEKFINALKSRLQQPLPGLDAQQRMSSNFRFSERFTNIGRENARNSAVLIPLYFNGSELSVVLMKRPSYKGAHSGQVSFPGGKHEETDTNLQHTALRESHEEVGLPPSSVQVLGQLTDLFIPASNFLVHPFVGFVNDLPQLVPDQHEVESILLPEMGHFFTHEKVEKDIRITKEFTLRAPYYEVDGHTVWGATAMILSELQQVLRETAY